jgi:hypothetical protein
MTVFSPYTYYIPHSWILKLEYLWKLDLLSRSCIGKRTSVEVVSAQPSPCSIMRIKREKLSRSIDKPLQAWTLGSHGKLGSLSLPIPTNLLMNAAMGDILQLINL